MVLQEPTFSTPTAAVLRKDSAAATVVIAALVALGPLATDMYLPAMPAMTVALDTGIDTVQLTLSVFLAGFAVSQLGYGALSDRFGRKPVLLGSLVLFVVATIGCASAQSAGSLIAWRLLQSVGACAGPVLGRAMVRDIHGPAGSARVLSYIGTVMALAPAVAPLAGGYLVVAFGWQSVFVVLALYGVAAFAVTAGAVPETNMHKDPGAIAPLAMARNFAFLVRDRLFLGYTLCCTFVFSGLFAFLSGSSFVIIGHFGVAEQHFGLYFAMVVAGYMSGTIVGGRLSHRHHYDTLIRAGALVSAAAGGAMWLAVIAGIDHVAAVIAPMVVYMAGVGVVMPQTIAGALAPFPTMAGAASALFGFLQMAIAALVGVLVGTFHDGGPGSMSTAIAVMGIATVASYRWLVAPAATGVTR